MIWTIIRFFLKFYISLSKIYSIISRNEIMQFSLRQYVCKTSCIDFGFTLCSQQILPREGKTWQSCQQWWRIRIILGMLIMTRRGQLTLTVRSQKWWPTRITDDQLPSFLRETNELIITWNLLSVCISLISWSGYSAEKINWWTQLTDPLVCFDFHVFLVFTFNLFVCSQQDVCVYVRHCFNTDFFTWF